MTPEERDSLAAELALGLLEGEELELAGSLLASDGGFRAEVARWFGRLAPMLEDIEDAQPPERLWRQISNRIGERSQPSAEIYQLRRKVTLWRGFSAAAMAIAASLALFLVVQPQTVAPPAVPAPTPAPAPLVARIGNDEAPMAMVATWDSANRRLMVAAASAARAEEGRSYELWVIPADGTPRSLGTMPAAPTIRLAVDEPVARQLHEGATLAVSVEPEGGSPTGLPTGPVIASGKLERA
ncbi:MAG: anti-sigma factor [Sphingomonas sp.]|nr:anti-sigma factor [Sphingomonas sp.]